MADRTFLAEALKDYPAVLSIQEIAEAVRLKRRTITHYILAGDLKAFNPDNELVVLKDDLIEFMIKRTR